MSETNKTPAEREAEKAGKPDLHEIMKPFPKEHYCSDCGARTNLCWCGTSRLQYRDSTYGR